MKRSWLLSLTLLLAACASEAPPADEPDIPAPPRVVAPPKPIDQCGAADMQALIGRPRTEIPVPVLPMLRRVACTTCPVTQDYNPMRLNIFYDADSGLVKEVRCG